MTVSTPAQNNQAQQPQAPVETKPSDKELNFRALEQKFQRELAQERAQREKLEQELKTAKKPIVEDEDDDEPWVDSKKFNRKFRDFEKNMEDKIDKKAEEKAYQMIEKKEQEQWINENPDFYNVLQNHAQAFAERSPKLAQSILRMPDNFERQKLVYQNIKELGLDKPPPKQPTIQETIDANKKRPYYQPTNVGTAPYAMAGDFSPQGQKQAYEKMQQLKSQMRLG